MNIQALMQTHYIYTQMFCAHITLSLSIHSTVHWLRFGWFIVV